MVLWAAVLLLATSSAPAQTLRGTVVDASGVAIAGANVTVRSASRTASLRSSSEGTFDTQLISPPASITASAPGFAAATTAWNGEPRVTLTLAPAQVRQEIVVTATRTSVALPEVAASVSKITGPDLDSSPALVVDDVLRQVPGFSLFRRTSSRTANPTSQGVSLRGLGASGASRALVLFDGVPLNDPFGGWVYWDRIPSTDIAAVEVLRGGGSALYGSGALAGVVSIDRSDVRDRVLSLDFSAGQQDTINGSATLTKSFKTWGWSGSAQAMRTDGYVPVPDSIRGTADASTNLRFATGRVIVDRQFSLGSFFVSGNLFNERRQNGTQLQRNSTRLMEGTLGTDLSVAGGSLMMRAFASGQHFDQTFSSISADRNSESLTRVQAVPAQQFGWSAVWNRELTASNTIAIGTDFRRVTGHSDEVGWARSMPTGTADAGGRQLYFGAFLEDLLRLGARLHINATARVDTWRNYDALERNTTFTPAASTRTTYAERNQAAFSPSLGAVFKVSRSISLTGSAYGAFRAPTLNELYRAFRLGNVLTLANDALRPERLRGWEAGIRMDSASLTLRATYFWNTIHDAIGNRTLTATSSLITRQRQNFGDIRSRGFEVELDARLPRHVVTRTAYEYSNSIVSRSLEVSLLDLRVTQVPRHSVSETVAYDSRRWSGSVVGRYVGGQFEDDLNTLHLPGYFSADAILRFHLTRLVEPYLACENVFNRSYVVGRTPAPSLGSPRLLRAGLRLRLGGDRATQP